VTKRTVIFGALALAVYLTVAIVAGPHVGRRPLYDGLAPAVPYRYVDPPRDLAKSNAKPDTGEGTIDLPKTGSASTSVTTGDGQMQVVFPKGVFAARAGAKVVTVRIVPLAPPPPLKVAAGLEITGNAYLVKATYDATSRVARPAKPVTAVLRYPIKATEMVVREGSSWRKLRSQNSQASLQLFANSPIIGTFAAAGPPLKKNRTWIAYAAGGLGLLAGIVGYLQGRRSGRKNKNKKKPKKRMRRR
jgi:hypothetical protein